MSTRLELRATRARIVATSDAERRKIERDLHDGARQHLIALNIRVGLARELADPDVAERLEGVGKELEEILEELRDLAQGVYPPLLREFGLQGALASAARRSASPAKLETAVMAVTPKTSRPPSTFAASKVSRTSANTPVPMRPLRFGSGSAKAGSTST